MKVVSFVVALILSLLIIGVVLPYNKDGYIRAQKYKMDYLAAPNRKPSVLP